MSGYVDAGVLPLSTDHVDNYRALVAEVENLWLRHGALQDSEKVDGGKGTGRNGVPGRAFSELAGSEGVFSIVLVFIISESEHSAMKSLE